MHYCSFKLAGGRTKATSALQKATLGTFPSAPGPKHLPVCAGKDGFYTLWPTKPPPPLRTLKVKEPSTSPDPFWCSHRTPQCTYNANTYSVYGLYVCLCVVYANEHPLEEAANHTSQCHFSPSFSYFFLICAPLTIHPARGGAALENFRFEGTNTVAKDIWKEVVGYNSRRSIKTRNQLNKKDSIL